MIAEFIGQGIHENESETCGNHICSSIKNEQFITITIFVAFLRKPGVLELKPFIQKAISENRKITVFVGRNEFITSKEALELLLELGVETYIYNADIFIYHPKVYLFEGKRNRIITGSSNLTKSGLFYNVESSLLLDFSNDDKQGMKVLNQLKDYFTPLLDFTDPNLEFVTQEHIEKLFAEGLIPTENYEHSEDSFLNKKDKKKFTIPEIGELGNIEISEDRPRKKYRNHTLTITEAYLEKWDFMFERIKKYRDDYENCTVKRDFVDHTLYAWYIKQKLLYNHPVLKMPEEHILKLRTIDFYFGDGHKYREEEIFKGWLELLDDAMFNKERIILNQGYFYKGRKLGTWLIGVSQANKIGKKLEIRKRIEDTGFDYANTSKAVENVIARLIADLYKTINPNKLDWRTRFFKHINKKEKLTQILWVRSP
jgi:HKD family nuclease